MGDKKRPKLEATKHIEKRPGKKHCETQTESN